MYGEMMKYFGLARDLDKASFFQTPAFKELMTDLKAAVRSGGIIALPGIVGSGKTAAAREIQRQLQSSKSVLVCKSLATEKRRVSIATLYTALFADLPTKRDFKPPTQTEKRERALQDLIGKAGKPVALFIDEAHELHWRTLVHLKHLVETVVDGNGTLSIILIGHPKLTNDLARPAMEEIGARAKLFPLDVVGTQKAKFIEWILKDCSRDKSKASEIITKDAIELLAEQLITPLQIVHYLTQSLVRGHQTGTKPIDVDIVQSTLSPDLDGLEARLARLGYNLATLCDHLNASRRDVRRYLSGQLAPGKAEVFNKEVHRLGVL